MSGGVILMGAMVASRSRARGFAPACRRGWGGNCGKDSSEALSKPSSDLSEIAVGPCPGLPRMPRFDMFKMSVLRVDQEAGGDREGSPLGFVRQPAKTERAADANRPVEDPRGQFKRAGELAGAAAQDHTGFRLCRKGRIRKPAPDPLKNLPR